MITRQIDRFDCATGFEFVCYFCREGVVNFRMRQVQILGNILKVQANLDLAHYSVVDVILCGKKKMKMPRNIPVILRNVEIKLCERVIRF